MVQTSRGVGHLKIYIESIQVIQLVQRSRPLWPLRYRDQSWHKYIYTCSNCASDSEHSRVCTDSRLNAPNCVSGLYFKCYSISHWLITPLIKILANACEAGWRFRCALLSLKMFFGLGALSFLGYRLCTETGKINVFAHETDTERAKAFLEELLENLSESSSPEGAGKEFAVEQ